MILTGGATLQNCNLTFSKIGGHLQIRECRFDKMLDCSSLSVGSDILIEDTDISEISFKSATVSGNLEMVSNNIDNQAYLQGLTYKRIRIDAFDDSTLKTRINNCLEWLEPVFITACSG